MPQIEELDFNEKTVLIIGGPTASGKSGLALDVALRHNGVVINADAMQVYKNIPIITAVPSDEDKAKVEHRLYEIYPPNIKGNVADWATKAVATIKEVWANKKLPIVVGGTGFYLETLVKGCSPIPDTAEKVKKIVVEQLGVAEDQVTEDAKFIDDLGADSLDLVELVMAFEEEFGSDIPDEDAEKLATVGDAIKYIESKQQNA